MANHKWDDNDKCTRCGLEREKRTEKILMAIVNHPPWNAYKYETKYAYSFDLKKWSFVRPDCKLTNQTTPQGGGIKWQQKK